MKKPVIIISLGAENGSITLYGVKLMNEWNFILRFTQIGEVEHLSINDFSIFNTTSNYGFQGAVELLDDYPWYMFIPRSIHPEFAEQFLKEVETRIASEQMRLNFWRRLVTRSLSLSNH